MKCEITLPSSSISLYQGDVINLLVIILSPFMLLICLWLVEYVVQFIKNLLLARLSLIVIYLVGFFFYLYILGMFIFTNLSFAGGFELIERCKDSGLTIGGIKMILTGLVPPFLFVISIFCSVIFFIALIKDVFFINKST